MPTKIPNAIHAIFDQAQIPLTLSDPCQDDDPIVLANDAFLRMAGYDREEVEGRNCRFLQGSETQPAMIETIRGDLTTNGDSRVLLTNYRKSGEAFDNLLYLFTVRDEDGNPVLRIGSQFEVPALERGQAFTAHAEALRCSLQQINAALTTAQHRSINTEGPIEIGPKALLTARLTTLRDSI